MFRPNSELVATAYLKQMLSDAGVTGVIVGTTLPQDKETWKEGFVQVLVAGGAPNVDLPVARPVIQVDCWVPSINSTKPQWGRANHIAEQIRSQVYTDDASVLEVVTLTGYSPARVFTSVVRTEPRRINDDPAGHARYTFDLEFNWVEVK